jgi:glucosamine-6-phosphate deaminase
MVKSIDEVPTQAISMSIKQIMSSRDILCIVPEKRKAEAVRVTVELPVGQMRPASILQQHAGTNLDRESSALLLQSASLLP